MVRYGAAPDHMGSFNEDQLFMENLKLLVIMAKAHLRTYPAGGHRGKAIQAVARNLFYDVLYRNTKTEPFEGKGVEDREDGATLAEHLFLQRTQLLAVMMTSMSANDPQGEFRNQALTENVDRICDHLSDHPNLQQIPFLKVA